MNDEHGKLASWNDPFISHRYRTAFRTSPGNAGMSLLTDLRTPITRHKHPASKPQFGDLPTYFCEERTTRNSRGGRAKASERTSACAESEARKLSFTRHTFVSGLGNTPTELIRHDGTFLSRRHHRGSHQKRSWVGCSSFRRDLLCGHHSYYHQTCRINSLDEASCCSMKKVRDL